MRLAEEILAGVNAQSAGRDFYSERFRRRKLFSAADDETIRVFNRADGRELRTIFTGSKVLSMAFSSRFRVALTGHAEEGWRGTRRHRFGGGLL